MASSLRSAVCTQTCVANILSGETIKAGTLVDWQQTFVIHVALNVCVHVCVSVCVCTHVCMCTHACVNLCACFAFKRFISNYCFCVS